MAPRGHGAGREVSNQPRRTLQYRQQKMTDLPRDINRRVMLAGLAGSAALAAGVDDAGAAAPAGLITGWLDAKEDFKARGDGRTDDSLALQSAINAGAESQRPVRLPPGAYPISRPLSVPPNTMLVGSSPGLGFCCAIEPNGCPAFVIGGKSTSFHCSLENFMIWPKGPAPDFVLSIDNSYSVRFRNIRIHEAQDQIKLAAVVLLGDADAGGHGRCANIIWENLIVRNDSGQPGRAILAARGCGTHRFIVPCLENYQILLDWQGGQIDLFAPYTERAGRFVLDCNLERSDTTSYLNTFGGIMDCANSGTGCAIRSTTRNFNSFGTAWGGSASMAAYVYAHPAQPVNFFGIVPNLTDAGKARFSGVAGWRAGVNFGERTLRTSRRLTIAAPAHGSATAELPLPGVVNGEYWARVAVNFDARAAHLSAYVSAAGIVTVVAQNTTSTAMNLSGVFTVECGVA